jgi:hypothetical protein
MGPLLRNRSDMAFGSLVFLFKLFLLLLLLLLLLPCWAIWGKRVIFR